MGGGNQKRYKMPSIEDIELGFRMSKKGYRILLNKNIQVKHLKRWGFLSMLLTNIFQRAIPWSRLILETKFMPKDLNFNITGKISALSVTSMILLILFLFFVHSKCYNISVAEALFLLLFLNVLAFNRKVYIFYARKRGVIFMLRVIPLHLLYYLYSGRSFFYSWVTYKISIPSY